MESSNEHDWRVGSYRYPLETLLKETIEQWREDRNASLPDNPHLRKAFDELADSFSLTESYTMTQWLQEIEQSVGSLLRTSETLGRGDNVSESEVATAYMSLSALRGDNHGNLRECMTENLVMQFMARALMKSAGAAERLILLTDSLMIIQRLQLPTPLGDFVQLVARSYVWGFDAECIAMCRSALEQALRKRVTYDMCEGQLGERNRGEDYSFSDRICVAKKEGLLSEELAKTVDDVRLRGNKIVHDDVNLTQKIDEVFRGTFIVIYALETGRHPYEIPESLRQALGFPPPWRARDVPQKEDESR